MKVRGLKKKRGFTLIEVMLVIAILVMITSSLFYMLEGVTGLSSAIEVDIGRREQINRFESVLRQAFRTLPPQSVFETDIEKSSRGTAPLIRFKNASNMFPVLNTGDGTEEFVLMAEPIRGGGYQIVLQSRPEDYAGNKLGRDNIPSLTLLSEIREVEWRYYDSRTGQWQETWTDSSTKPVLISFKLELFESDVPYEIIFWIPVRQLTESGENQTAQPENESENETENGNQNEGNQNPDNR